jgi:hypothetical protein
VRCGSAGGTMRPARSTLSESSAAEMVRGRLKWYQQRIEALGGKGAGPGVGGGNA